MKVLIQAAALCILLAACQSSLKPAQVLSSNPAPDFEMVSLQGKNISLSSLTGKNVMVHFWASWCSSCLHELKTLQNVYKNPANQNLEILAIAVEDKLPAVQAASQSLHLSFPIFFDEYGVIKKRYKVNALPQSFFVGPDGGFLEIKDPETGTLTSHIVGARTWDQGNGLLELKKLSVK